MDLFRLHSCEENSYKGSVQYLHNGNVGSCCAFLTSERASLRINVPRFLGVSSISITILDEAHLQRVCSFDAIWCGVSGADDIYSASLPNMGVGLYFYYLEVSALLGRLYGHYENQELLFSKDLCKDKLFQLSFSEFSYPVDEKLYGGVIYHIFVDRFAKGGNIEAKPEAIYVDDWSSGIPEYPAYPGAPLKNNTFYGGTLYGVIEKLPFIASLGTTIIYLSPVFESPSNHKYDTADYMTVDSMFGGDAALMELIERAREYNIGIVLDGVFNHTGADSIYFNKYNTYDTLGAYQSSDSPYYTWYDFKNHPDDYTAWWGIEILPRINPDIKECGEYFVGDGGVIEKYARMGIAGLRLDVVDELSDEFVKRIKSRLANHISAPLLYGEVWEDASNKIAYGKRKRYYLGGELDGVMNYPLRSGIIDYLRYGKTDNLSYALSEIINNAPERIRDMQMNLLGTHDTPRILTMLGGDEPYGYDNAQLRSKRMTIDQRCIAVARLKMAYTILATLPGIPTIFYGDEAGLEGYSDPFNRMPYPWGYEDDGIIEHYQKLGAIRRDSAAYARGEFKLLHMDTKHLIYARYLGNVAYLTVVNNSLRPLVVNFDMTYKTLIGDVGALPPMSASIFKVSRQATIYI